MIRHHAPGFRFNKTIEGQLLELFFLNVFPFELVSVEAVEVFFGPTIFI